MVEEQAPQTTETQDLDDVYERACALAEADQHPEAAALFRQAAELGHRHAWLALGNSLGSLGRHAEAVDAYRAAAEMGDPDAFLNLGIHHEELQGWASAEVAYRHAETAGDARAILALGDLWRWHGDPAAAKDLLQKAASRGDAYSAGYLGVWLRDEDSTADVEALLRQGADVDDDARSDLAWILRARGHFDEAENLLRRGVNTGHLDSSIKLALLLEEDRHDLAGAEDVLRQAAAAGELFAWNNLGTLLRDQRRFFEAQTAFQHGADGADALAVRNLRHLHSTYRRQINRSHRRRKRAIP
ncbi:hypothetical protein GCM10022223_41900 [Kineosporia mesophila]|uniref:Tetratricopeptide repeat protein n=1 Tax=Kineosporia mesophila TaxID=566012 RepID=A0ABP6ZZ08_9ACTN|nr:tetratricopeptide repeat protein [Kineosporia mesophila]MCD5355238.1 tetratricopeptide repeat protein [Kineosporia mesophila]